MKKGIFFAVALMLFLLQPGFLHSASFIKVQADGGYMLPMPGLNSKLNGAVMYGGAMEIKLPIIPFISEYELSFNTATLPSIADSTKTLSLSPLMLCAKLDLSSGGLKPFVKIGGGLVFESSNITGSVVTQNDPCFTGGLGASYALMPAIELKIEAEYLFIYQTWVPSATENGSALCFKLGLTAGF